MSASREKKIRFEERSEGTEKRQVRSVDMKKALKRKRIISTAATIAVVALLVVAVVFNSTLFYTGVNALEIGSWKFNAADVNYEYYSQYYTTYQNLYESYGEYTSTLLDPSKPLDEQPFSETQTWQDYFEESAVTQLQQMSILNDMADRDGFQLDAEQVSQINSAIESIKTQAAENGYTDYKAYLRAMYGKGFTEDIIREHLTNSYRATYYSAGLVEKWSADYTEEEKLEYYDSIKADYNLISYLYYYVDGSADDENGIDADTALANAKAIADEIASAVDEDTFLEVVKSYDADATLESCSAKYINPSNLSGEGKTFLVDSERKYGDTTIISGDSGYSVVMFTESNGNEFHMVDYDAIVIPVGTDEEGNINDTYLTEAKQEADAIIASYNEDATADNFASLMTQNNSDTTIGGSHQNVVLGDVSVSEIQDYLFDTARQEGDITAIYKDGNYYVVRFSGMGEQYNLYIAEGMKAQEQYTAMLKAAEPDYPISTKFAYRFAM